MIFRSPSPHVPIPAIPFARLVFHRADEIADRPALIDAPTQRTLTYRQLVDDVHRAAASLYARGFRKGDVFALMTPNSLEFAIAFFGVLEAGGVVTTLNPLNAVDELVNQLDNSGAQYY